MYGSTHVWLDHNTFTDGSHPDSAAPVHFGMLYQQHDGELDIVRGANHVTASWNVFTEHDKTILIGNSDSESTAVDDRGKLKVTFHHNLFSDLTERTPRVRFGQVDVYNNHFKAGSGYGYSFGIGKESQLVAEHNAFTLPRGISPAKVLKRWNDSPLTARHNLVNGRPVDLIAVHNARIPEETLRSGAGWTPTLRAAVHPPGPSRPWSTSARAPAASADPVRPAGTPVRSAPQRTAPAPTTSPRRSTRMPAHLSRRNVLLAGAAAGSALASAAAPAQAARRPRAAFGRHGSPSARLTRSTLYVHPEGAGDFTGVQAAVDAATGPGRTLVLAPGVYRETVSVPADRTDMTWIGASEDPGDVVVVYDNAAGTPKPDGSGTYGTSGSATTTLRPDGFTARRITFANDWLRADHPGISGTQAVAVKVTGDRSAFLHCRFLGHQDTLYADSASRTPSPASTSPTATPRGTSTSSSAGPPRSSSGAGSTR